MDSIAGGMYGAVSILPTASPRADREFVDLLRDPPRASRRSTGARSSATRRCCTRASATASSGTCSRSATSTTPSTSTATAGATPTAPRSTPRPSAPPSPSVPHQGGPARDVALPLPRGAAHDARDDRPLPGEEVRRALPLAAVALAVAGARRRRDRADRRHARQVLRAAEPHRARRRHRDMDQQRPFDHDVAAIGGGFDSGHVSPGRRFSHPFTLPGHYAYRCTIHPFMAGSVDVYAFQLLGPDRPHRRRLAGDAARHRARRHERGADRGPPPGPHWAPVTAVAPAPDGSFRVRVTPPPRPSTARSSRPARACRCRCASARASTRA